MYISSRISVSCSPVVMSDNERFIPKRRILIFLFVSHFFSRWGDRMWSFGVPLFLVVVYCNSLLLAAIYGLILTLALTLFGTWVGDFVDASPRLKFVVLTLFLNNLFITLNSLCLMLIIILNGLQLAYFQPLLYTLSVFLTIFGSLARLASLGTNISVEKDWVVVIAHKDKGSLACINTNLRRIDLICKLFAPLFITLIMHFAGLVAAAIVLAAWNVISFFVETILINFVYNLEPNLATKEYRHKDDISEDNTKVVDSNNNNNNEDNEASFNQGSEDTFDDCLLNQEVPRARLRMNGDRMHNTKRFARRLKRKLFKLPKSFIIGWRIYLRQRVRLVGLSMACLYLTVLGFSGVTAGYFYTQGMTELYLGIAQAVAGVIGVAATFAFPYIRRLTGTVRTGVIGISLQLFSLIFCVIGVFAPGNPTFDSPPPSAACQFPIASMNMSTTPSMSVNTISFMNMSTTPSMNMSTLPTFGPLLPGNHTNTTGMEYYQYTSLAFMVTGVVTARFGLWIFDLSVIQIVQENVIESERGVVNGIMSSMNFFNDMIHFLLVTILPNPSQFGYLTIVSFLSISTAWILFFVFVMLHEREAFFSKDGCCGYREEKLEPAQQIESSDDEVIL